MPFDARLCHPATFIFAGPTGCGKSTFASNLILNKNILFKEIPKNVYIFCSNKQDTYDELLNRGMIRKIFNEVPTYDVLKKMLIPFKNNGGSLILLDDMLNGNFCFSF